MFRRRTKRRFHQLARELVWPSSGWRRAILYVRHRLQRLPGSAYSIAAGFACGVAVSFTPLVGTHFILAGIAAWLIRANVISSAVGTLVGNPWTFPFMWAGSYTVGRWITGLENGGVPPPSLTVSMVLDRLAEDPAGLWSVLIGPTVIGGIPLGILAGFVTYALLYPLVSGYQDRRRRRMIERREELAELRNRTEAPS